MEIFYEAPHTLWMINEIADAEDFCSLGAREKIENSQLSIAISCLSSPMLEKQFGNISKHPNHQQYYRIEVSSIFLTLV